MDKLHANNGATSISQPIPNPKNQAQHGHHSTSNQHKAKSSQRHITTKIHQLVYPDTDAQSSEQATKSSLPHASTSNIINSSTSPTLPPTIYGELSILGYNGYIPSGERNGRRNRSKFLLCKRPQPNGIKKSRHYIVKQPQATKAIQNKDLHSISYTFTRTQTIIVEYKQDEKTDMFQIGRSSEEPIDFVVMDTAPANINSPPHHVGKHSFPADHNNAHNENTSNMQPNLVLDAIGVGRLHRHMSKFNEDMMNYGIPPSQDSRGRLQIHPSSHGQSPVLLSYPQSNSSNLPAMIINQFRNQQTPSIFHHSQYHHHDQPNASHSQNQYLYPARDNAITNNNEHQHERSSNRYYSNNNNQISSTSNSNLICKRSHVTQSTISRFACRILVDREPPYTARIYAAGFDSSKNIFLGEKATKWEQNNSIDGLTTNGVLIMHPKRGFFQKTIESNRRDHSEHSASQIPNYSTSNNEGQLFRMSGDNTCIDEIKHHCSREDGIENSQQDEAAMECTSENQPEHEKDSVVRSTREQVNDSETNHTKNLNSDRMNNHESLAANSDSNNNDMPDNQSDESFEYGGVWREVSVDGGMYAIRESRSAVQKGTRIESETNILQDGTLIDLCGATLLWRSIDGFKASPTRKSLEEKIDSLNASRPQCPVGLNTLVIPRKPIIPLNHRRHHHHHHHNHQVHVGYGSKDHYSGKDEGAGDGPGGGHQPYVYLKCGHVQGYHDWGATEKSNQRTCPICLSVGTVAKLSMGLEPSFYVDSGLLTHVFNPCGHMASERTVKYWCSIKIPHGTHFFHSICPFCATPLATNEPSSIKLIFQEDLD